MKMNISIIEDINNVLDSRHEFIIILPLIAALALHESCNHSHRQTEELTVAMEITVNPTKDVTSTSSASCKAMEILMRTTGLPSHGEREGGE